MANKYALQSRRAQDLRRKRRSCLDKVGLLTAADARQEGQGIYKCRHCSRWHRTGQLASLLAMTRKFGPAPMKKTKRNHLPALTGTYPAADPISAGQCRLVVQNSDGGRHE